MFYRTLAILPSAQCVNEKQSDAFVMGVNMLMPIPVPDEHHEGLP